MTAGPIVFLIDVDNTLLDNDGIQNDLRNHAAAVGAHFVRIDEADSSLAWDLSGRTIVALRGRVFKTKD